MSTSGNDPLDDLSAALLAALADARVGDGVSLPRLVKQLGFGASVLLRRLTLMSDASIGGATGPGWVRVTQRGDRQVVALTDAGRERIADGADRHFHEVTHPHRRRDHR